MDETKELRNQRHEAARILGARDGYIGALLMVRNEIARLRDVKPADRFVRQSKQWERAIAPLLRLERIFDDRQKQCDEAYKLRTPETPSLVRKE